MDMFPEISLYIEANKEEEAELEKTERLEKHVEALEKSELGGEVIENGLLLQNLLPSGRRHHLLRER